MRLTAGARLGIIYTRASRGLVDVSKFEMYVLKL